MTLKEIQYRQTEISALLESARHVLKHKNFNNAARAIFDSCKRLIGATAGYIALLSANGTENEVLFLDAGGVACTVDPSLPMPIRGLREQAYRTGNVVYHNAFGTSEWTDYLPEGHSPIANVLFSPLILEETVVGLLGLANKSGGFTEHDTHLAKVFGELVAVALHNSRLLEALETSETRFRAVVKSANDAIITIDHHGIVVFWNPAAEVMFDYSIGEIIGQPLTNIIPKRFRTAFQNGLKQMVITRELRFHGKPIELMTCRKDGTEIPLELSLATWKTQDGLFITGIGRSITNRKQNELKLKNERDHARYSEERYRDLFDSSPIALMEEDFSAVKQYLDQLQASKIMDFQTYFEQNPQEVVQCAKMVHFININQVSLDLYKATSKEELLEKLNTDFSDESYDTFRDELINFAQGNSVFETEKIIKTTSGKKRYVSLRSSIPTSYKDSWAKVLVSILDITDRKLAELMLQQTNDDLEFRVKERTIELTEINEKLRRAIEKHKQTENALRESEKRLTEAQRIAHWGHWNWDIETNELHWSDELYRIFGLVPQEFPAKYETFLAVIHPDDRDFVQKSVNNAIKEKIPYNIEFRIVQPNETTRIVHEQAEVTFDKLDKPIRMIGTTHDITERKKVEEALRKSEARLIEAQRIAQLGNWDWNIITNEIHWSDEIYRIFGLTPREFGANYEAFMNSVHPDDRDFVDRAVNDAVNQKQPYNINHRIVRPDGSERIVHEQAEVIFNEMDVPIRMVGTVQDITEHKKTEESLFRAEEEKKQIQTRLFQAQKMEAIGTLTGGIAHDFNNLLTVILGYAEQSMHKLDETDPLHRYLNQIHNAGIRAADLIRKLLLFSRKQPMEMTAINLNQTIGNLLSMLNRLLGEDLTVTTNLASNLWKIRGDATNIEQVLMNLVVNARDAMPDGGTITITAKNSKIGKEYCKTVLNAKPGRFVCLTVEDTGVGMTSDLLERIFEPFFTTKEPGKGTGLGLAVVYGIIHQHYGWITVSSEPGQGSVFNVYLPVFLEEVTTEQKNKKTLENFQGSGERILLVEDEKAVRGFATQIFEQNGYTVFAVSSVKEAHELFEREEGQFHLLCSDVVLPDGNGLQLVEHLIARNADLRVILSSGYTDQKSQWNQIRKRGFRFIQKPFKVFELLKIVHETLQINLN